MKVYKVSYRNVSDEHQGYTFFSNKKDAEKSKKKHEGEEGENNIDPEIQEYEIEISKKGILKALNHLASHPDNG